MDFLILDFFDFLACLFSSQQISIFELTFENILTKTRTSQMVFQRIVKKLKTAMQIMNS